MNRNQPPRPLRIVFDKSCYARRTCSLHIASTAHGQARSRARRVRAATWGRSRPQPRAIQPQLQRERRSQRRSSQLFLTRPQSRFEALTPSLSRLRLMTTRFECRRILRRSFTLAFFRTSARCSYEPLGVVESSAPERPVSIPMGGIGKALGSQRRRIQAR